MTHQKPNKKFSESFDTVCAVSMTILCLVGVLSFVFDGNKTNKNKPVQRKEIKNDTVRDTVYVSDYSLHLDVVKTLLSGNPDKCKIENALLTSVNAGDTTLLKVLLSHSQIEHRNDHILMIAAHKGYLKTAEIILKKGVSQNIKNRMLYVAMSKNDNEMVNLLLKYGAVSNNFNKQKTK